VKIDFATVGRFDEAALIRRQKLCHPTVAFRRVLLDLAQDAQRLLVEPAERRGLDAIGKNPGSVANLAGGGIPGIWTPVG
jgi:hypothetical protein